MEERDMKKLSVVICLLWFLVPSIALAGEIRVYDHNNQYLGILDSYPRWIFIPSIEKFMQISSETGDLGNYNFFYESECFSFEYLLLQNKINLKVYLYRL